jgi:hypothetical protein
MSSQAPYGWKIVMVNEHRRLEVEPREMMTKMAIIEMTRAGKKPKEITDTLNEYGLKNRVGAPWRLNTVIRLLKKWKEHYGPNLAKFESEFSRMRFPEGDFGNWLEQEPGE